MTAGDLYELRAHSVKLVEFDRCVERALAIAEEVRVYNAQAPSAGEAPYDPVWLSRAIEHLEFARLSYRQLIHPRQGTRGIIP